MNYFKLLFEKRVDVNNHEYEDLITGLFTSDAGQKVLNYWIASDLHQPSIKQGGVNAEVLLWEDGRRSLIRHIIGVITSASKRAKVENVIKWQ